MELKLVKKTTQVLFKPTLKEPVRISKCSNQKDDLISANPGPLFDLNIIMHCVIAETKGKK